MTDYQGMRHKLMCITVVVPQIPCCLDKEKPSDVPRGEVMGVQTPVESSICFSIVYAQKYCPSYAPVFMKFKNFVHENVKKCTLFSHFASVYWLFPWTQLGDFCPPDCMHIRVSNYVRSAIWRPAARFTSLHWRRGRINGWVQRAVTISLTLIFIDEMNK